MKRAAHIIAALLLASACEPAALQLDGAPASAAEETPAPGELAGAADTQQIILPGVMNIAAPVDAKVMKSCETVIAVDYDQPPAMACVFFLRDSDGVSPDAAEFDRLLDYQLVTAGWTLVRSAGAQHYFEHAKPDTDCADLSVFTALDDIQLDHLVKAANTAPGPAGKSWRGYSVLATILQTCGADRMRP